MAAAYAGNYVGHIPALAHAQNTDNEPDYQLVIQQQPENARVAIGKEKDRKPVDPPPIIQLKRSAQKDPQQNYLQSPYYFVSCTLIRGTDDGEDPNPNALLGTLVSSLHRLRDSTNTDGGFFVFGDLSVKREGVFRLHFSLYQMKDLECIHLSSVTSKDFTVYPAKTFPGMAESTFLTRSFSDQGVRLRLRKDSRSMKTRKRNNQAGEDARKEWDRRQQAIERQASITEGELTPTDHGRGGAGPPHYRGGPEYYDRYFGQNGGYSLYGEGPTAKRPRHSNDPTRSSPTAVSEYGYHAQQPLPRASFADVSPSLTLPPTTSSAVSMASYPHNSIAGTLSGAGPMPYSAHAQQHLHHGASTPFAPHRIDTQLGGQHHPYQLGQTVVSAGATTASHAGSAGVGSAHSYTSPGSGGQPFHSPTTRQSPATYYPPATMGGYHHPPASASLLPASHGPSSYDYVQSAQPSQQQPADP